MGWILAALVAAVLLLIACSACLFALFLPQLLGGRGELLSGLHPKAIFLLSPEEGWIVGRGFRPHDLDVRPAHTENLQYRNGDWLQVSSPQVGFACLSLLAPNDGWAGTEWDVEHMARARARRNNVGVAG